jgi:drug/metabolite transporter (DMT)-like permease
MSSLDACIPVELREPFWLTVWFFCNLAVTLSTKSLFKLFSFTFPQLVTLSHLVATGFFSAVLVFWAKVVPAATLDQNQRTRIALFSMLFVVNIVLSNVALRYVSVSMHQIIRSTTPAITVLLELPESKTVSQEKLITLIPVVGGVMLACYAPDNDSSMAGIVLTVVSAVVSACKGILTNRFMVGRYKLSELDMLSRMAPLAALELLPMYWMSGEHDQVAEFVEQGHFTQTLALFLMGSAFCAFALNIASFSASRCSTPLPMTVAGNVKQVCICLQKVACKLFLTCAMTMKSHPAGAHHPYWNGVVQHSSRCLEWRRCYDHPDWHCVLQQCAI